VWLAVKKTKKLKDTQLLIITGDFVSGFPMSTVNSDLSSVSAGMTLIDADKSTCVGSL